jgi:diacylglycerol kinase family enzyme
MKRIACIYNAGSGSAAEKHPIEQQFNDLGITTDFIAIESDKQVIADKLKQQPYMSVVAAGGDGTVRLAAQFAIQAKLPLGILPLGTLNHFAKDLGLPIDLAEAAKVIANGTTAPADYCEVNDQIFLNNASLGIYPATVIDREKTQKHWGKWLAAAKGFIGALRTNKNMDCTIVAPEGSWEYSSPLIFVGNNKYHIDRAGLSGRDKLNGARMFLYVVQATNRRRLVILALLNFLGFHLRSTASARQTKGPLTIKSAQSSTDIALDGEVFKMKFPLHFAMNAGQLTVLRKG